MPDEDSAPTITDSETTIEDNSVTVIVETPEPETTPDEEPAGPTLETVLAMITALAADMAGVRGEVAAINARLDNAESQETTTDDNFSETIESAPPAEPEPDTGPTSSHFWFRSVG